MILFLYRLRELKAKLKEQRKHLDELDKHMYVNSSNPAYYEIGHELCYTKFTNSHYSDQLTKEQGGEQN